MTQEEEAAVSEPIEPTATEEVVEQKMVPLAALEAERRKRQDIEAKAIMYQDQLLRATSQKEEPEEDPHALVEKGAFKEATAMTKREILEEIFLENNAEAVQQINKYLPLILEKKPWLANSVDSAKNRYARAYEIVQDYRALVEEPKRSVSNDAKKIVENAQKPRSPVEIGKSARPSGAEYLKSIQGKKEFREYRQKVLRGEI